MNVGRRKICSRVRATILLLVCTGSTGASALAQGPGETLSASFRKAVDRTRSSVVAVRPLDPVRPLLPGIMPPVGPLRPGELIPRVLPRASEIEAEFGGSGVVIDADRGYVLTTDHALRGSSRAAVVLADGRDRLAGEIRRAPEADLAVLLIDPKGLNLTAAGWGDPGRLEPCDWVVAVGQPAGAAPAISVGIFSARRGGVAGAPAPELLETDATVASVQSGGPLVNVSGEVVGICIGPVDSRSASSGMSYAIPADRVRRTALELIEFGRTRHAFLGVQVEPAQAVQRNRPTALRGVVITSVTAGTPAALVGLHPGDAIVSVGGRPVTSVAMLQAMVEAAPIGEELPLGIERDGRRLEVKIRPQAQPVRGATGPAGVQPRRSETGREEPRVRSRLGERPSPDAAQPSPPAPPAEERPAALDLRPN
jgi:serine protease Do